jgi:hypothetical protein
MPDLVSPTLYRLGSDEVEPPKLVLVAVQTPGVEGWAVLLDRQLLETDRVGHDVT